MDLTKLEALAIPAQTGTVTVDTPEFRQSLDWMLGMGYRVDDENAQPNIRGLVRDIDAHTAAAVAAAVAGERERAVRLALQWGNAREDENGGHALRCYAQALRHGDEADERDSDYHWSKAPAPVAVSDLYAQIMNLQSKSTMSHFVSTDDMRLYKEGHRDARHAAAELVTAHTQLPAAVPVTETGLPELRDLLKIAAVYGDPMLLSSASAGALCHAMTTGQPAAKPGQPPAGELPVLPDAKDPYHEFAMLAIGSMAIRNQAEAKHLADEYREVIATRQPAPVADAGSQPTYSASELLKFGETRYQQGRAAGLEEAARCVEDFQADNGIVSFTDISFSIRALNKTGAA